jgi:hypothetical protein
VELRNVFRNGSPPFVQSGRVFDIRWTDSTRVKVDTAPVAGVRGAPLVWPAPGIRPALPMQPR